MAISPTPSLTPIPTPPVLEGFKFSTEHKEFFMYVNEENEVINQAKFQEYLDKKKMKRAARNEKKAMRKKKMSLLGLKITKFMKRSSFRKKKTSNKGKK